MKYENIGSVTTIPKPQLGPDWDPRMDLVIKVLRGGVAVTARKLAAKCGFKATGNCSELRQEIKRAVKVFNIPIVGTAKGFLYADNPYQVQAAINDLEQRKKVLESDIEAYKRIKEGLRNGTK